MHTLLACSRALILLVLAPILFAEARIPREMRMLEPTVRPDTSRPLMDMRDVIGLVTSDDHIDVYWLHTNELEDPARSIFYRTRISADGAARLGTTRIHQFDGGVNAHVTGAGANVQVIWTGNEGTRVSPIEGDALKYPLGKRLPFSDYVSIFCRATECLATYAVSGTPMAVLLDSDGNMAGIPFNLPHGFAPMRIVFDERGIFFVRHDHNELRAALIGRDGRVQFDVRLAAANPRAFHSSIPAVTTNGVDYVVAFVEFGTTPDELHAVTVTIDGRVTAPTRLMQLEEHRDLPNNFGAASIAANGSRFLLGGYYVIGRPFLTTLDAAMQPTGSRRTDAIPSVHAHPDGSSFIVIWQTPSPYVTIVRADGSMTAPVPIVPLPRRRAVR